MATKSIDVGDMFLMDLIDSLDDHELAGAAVDESQLMGANHKLGHPAAGGVASALAITSQRRHSHDTQFTDLHTLSQIQNQRNHTFNDSHLMLLQHNKLATMPNNGNASSYHQQEAQHMNQQLQQQSHNNKNNNHHRHHSHLLWTPLGPTVVSSGSASASASSSAVLASANSLNHFARNNNLNQDVVLEDSGFSDKLDEANIYVEASTPISSSSGTSINDDSSTKSCIASSSNLTDDIVSVESSLSSFANTDQAPYSVDDDGRAKNDSKRLSSHQKSQTTAAMEVTQKQSKPFLNNITGTNLINKSQRSNVPTSGHHNYNHNQNKQYLRSDSPSSPISPSSNCRHLSASLPIKVPIVAKQNFKSNKNGGFKISNRNNSNAAIATEDANNQQLFDHRLQQTSSGKLSSSTSISSSSGGFCKQQKQEFYAQQHNFRSISGAGTKHTTPRSLYQLEECEDSCASEHMTNEENDERHFGLNSLLDSTAASNDGEYNNEHRSDEDDYSYHRVDADDDERLSEDEYTAIRENPSKILKSIEALARSVHDDSEVFGSLPRRQFNTGELVRSLRLA